MQFIISQIIANYSLMYSVIKYVNECLKFVLEEMLISNYDIILLHLCDPAGRMIIVEA